MESDVIAKQTSVHLAVFSSVEEVGAERDSTPLTRKGSGFKSVRDLFTNVH